jgi:D-arabinose 1-dehydrogenase-like Zn-dependent alcohol dehydrogenase
LGVLVRLAGLAMNSRGKGRKMRSMLANTNTKDLSVLRDMIEAGKVSPLIVENIQLDNVKDAMRRQGEGHTRGKTVISI